MKKSSVGAVPDRHQIAARGGDGECAARPVETDVAAILLHGAQDRWRSLQQAEGTAGPAKRDERHAVSPGPFILHGNRNPALPADSEMADAQQAEVAAETHLLVQVACLSVDETERGFHRRQVELRPGIIGMGVDAAIGDRQRPAVRQHPDVVRTDAARGEFAKPLEVIARVVDANDAAAGVEVVLGSVE